MNYAVKKSVVYPKGGVHWYENIYLGMSMSNKIFHSQSSLLELLNFIGGNTNRFSVLVGDYLHRYNLQIFDGLSENEAIRAVVDQSKLLTEVFRQTIDQTENKIDYKFLFTKDLKNSVNFDKKMERFKKLYKDNEHFKSLTEHTVAVFLRRQNNIKVSPERARQLCRLYLFEELVIFEILAEEGYKVNIYPGNQLPIIKAIVTGQLKNVSEPLETIQAVEIKLRPKQIAHAQ